MTVLWSGQQRKKRKEYLNWGKTEIEKLLKGVSEICRSFEETLLRFNILLIGAPNEEGAPQEFDGYIRNEAYAALLINVIDKITSAGGQPIIQFDSQKQSAADAIIHGWARDVFQGGQANLLYSFLSHSIIVPEPVFVQPASHPLLELADIMSFAVARHHFCLANGKAPDIDLSILGNVMYMTFSHGNADLLFQQSKGFPWKMKYPKAEAHGV